MKWLTFVGQKIIFSKLKDVKSHNWDRKISNILYIYCNWGGLDPNKYVGGDAQVVESTSH